jgi:hypothetical protein
VIEQIKEFTFKRRSPEKLEGLLPTLPNLYGLDIRFRYTERKIKEEKERRRATSKPGRGGAGDASDYKDPFAAPPNRHEIMSKKS